jgi:hypothetical protein
MSSDTNPLLRSIHRWLLVIAFLLGVGIITIAHIGYVQNATHILYWQSLVFSVAGVLGGVVALVAGLMILRSYSSAEDIGRSAT